MPILNSSFGQVDWLDSKVANYLGMEVLALGSVCIKLYSVGNLDKGTSYQCVW